MIKKTVFILLFLCTNIFAANEVNVYSHRHYAADKQLFKMFESKTGIKVNIVKASSNELIKRLEKEGMSSPADVLITVDVGRLYSAQEKGLLQPFKSQYLESVIPEHLRDKEGYWYALTKRARVFAYNKERVKPSELSTYESLADEKYRGKILTQNSANIYNQSLLASIIENGGEENAKKWADSLVKNFAREPVGNDTDQMRAVAAGVGDIAIVNTYYVGQLMNSEKFSDKAVAESIGVFFPNQNDRGTHINISGASITKSSKNRENAIKFIEFLASEEAQKVFVEVNYEYPANKNVAPSKLLTSWGVFKEDNLPLYKLGKRNVEAVKIMHEVNWQ